MILYVFDPHQVDPAAAGVQWWDVFAGCTNPAIATRRAQALCGPAPAEVIAQVKVLLESGASA